MIKCAIFDLDGTLLDSMHYWRGVHKQYLKEKFGIIEEEDISQITMQQSDYESACWVRDRYNLPISYEEADQGINETMIENYKTKVHVKPGMIDLLEELYKRNIIMGVASSTFGPLIKIAVEYNGLSKYFKTITSSYDVGKGKKHPDIYIKCAKDLGFDVSESIVFEDLPYGLVSSKTVGAKTVGLYDDASINLQEELKKVSDIYCKDMDTENINKILELLK